MRHHLLTAIGLLLLCVSAAWWLCSIQEPTLAANQPLLRPRSPVKAPALWVDPRSPVLDRQRTAIVGIEPEVVELPATPTSRCKIRATPKRSALVNVQGCVRRHGIAVPDYELMFYAKNQGLDGDEQAWVRTDESGIFELLLPARDYAVFHDRSGPWIADINVPQLSVPQFHVPQLHVPKPNVPQTKTHFVDIDLPNSAIRGTVYRENQQIVGANIVAIRSMGEGIKARSGVTNSDAQGNFALEDLTAGDYWLLATIDQQTSQPLMVAVAAGSQTSVRLQLGDGQTLRGTIRAPDGSLLAMQLRVCSTLVPSLRQLSLVSRLHSQQNGEFVIHGLSPGPYVLYGTASKKDNDYVLNTEFSMSSQEQSLELTAQMCGTLSIRITQENDTPISGAAIDILSSAGPSVVVSHEWLNFAPTSNNRGQIHLCDVVPGHYWVSAIHAGKRGIPRPVDIQSDEVTRLDLDLVIH